MAFLRQVVTPAGVPAVHEVGLAGLAHLGQDEGMGQWEDITASLPDLIRAGGDVASQVYRAVNYSPTQYPTTYTGAYMTAGGPGLLSGISPTTLLVLGGGLLLLLAMRK